jgi:hypothetical protein
LLIRYFLCASACGAFAMIIEYNLGSLPDHNARWAMTILAVLLVCAGIPLATIITARANLARERRKLIFTLTDKELIRTHEGWPEVRIALQEISGLYQQAELLTVKASGRRISIPASVQKFELLRAELMKHHECIALPSRPKSSLVPLSVSLVFWALMLLSHRPTVIAASALGGMATLAWSTVHLLRRFPAGSKRAWPPLAISWMSALGLVCFRFTHLPTH